MARPPGTRQDPNQPPLEADGAPLRDRRGLRKRERLFVEAYCGVANFNATKAYAIAGYTPGRENAARLTKKDHIAAAIEERAAEREAELVITGREAKERISRIARASVRPFLPPDDPLLKRDPITGERLITDEEIALIKALRPGKYGRVLELHDALKGLELSAKIAGVLKDTVKLEHTLEDIVCGAGGGANAAE